MNFAETHRLLVAITAIDNRRLDDAMLRIWQEVLAPYSFNDCHDALIRHLRDSTDYLLPAHIAKGAKECEHRRTTDQLRARSQARQAAVTELAIADSGGEPVADVRQLVTRLREQLPPGNRAKLRRYPITPRPLLREVSDDKSSVA